MNELATQALANEELAKVFLEQKFTNYKQDFERHHKYKRLPPDYVGSSVLDEERLLRARARLHRGGTTSQGLQDAEAQHPANEGARLPPPQQQQGGRSLLRNKINGDESSPDSAKADKVLLQAPQHYAMDGYVSFFERDLCQVRQLLSSFFYHVASENRLLVPYLHVAWVSVNHPRRFKRELAVIFDELVCTFGAEILQRKLRLYVFPWMDEFVKTGAYRLSERGLPKLTRVS